MPALTWDPTAVAGRFWCNKQYALAEARTDIAYKPVVYLAYACRTYADFVKLKGRNMAYFMKDRSRKWSRKRTVDKTMEGSKKLRKNTV